MKRHRLRTKTHGSRLEAKFALYWRGLSGPELQREIVFYAERKWRADFAHIASKTIFEIEGGVFIKGGGRHNRAAGFIADATKHIEAFLAGWSAVRTANLRLSRSNSSGVTAKTVTRPIVPSGVISLSRTARLKRLSAEIGRAHV